MSTNHFNYFRVKNFKRFKDLEVKDIGQFNLVLGDNNVGKTSLLESLLCLIGNGIEGHVAFLCLAYKEKFDAQDHYGLWKYYFNDTSEPKEISFKYKNELGVFIERAIRLVKQSKLYSTNNHRFVEYDYLDNEYLEKHEIDYSDVFFSLNTESYFPLISLNNLVESRIVKYYINSVQNSISKKKALIKSMKMMVNSINDFEPTLDHNFDTYSIGIRDNQSKKFRLLNSYGDGTIKLFKILNTIIHFSNHSVYIDEIDAGIYYQRMKDYWKVILQSAYDNEVQLFATTHNRECIEAFEKALEELGEDFTNRARTITLKYSKEKDDIIAFTNKFNVLQYAIETGNDIR